MFVLPNGLPADPNQGAHGKKQEPVPQEIWAVGFSQPVGPNPWAPTPFMQVAQAYQKTDICILTHNNVKSQL